LFNWFKRRRPSTLTFNLDNNFLSAELDFGNPKDPQSVSQNLAAILITLQTSPQLFEIARLAVNIASQTDEQKSITEQVSNIIEGYHIEQAKQDKQEYCFNSMEVGIG